MHRFSVALIAALGTVAFAQFASAADMPVKAPIVTASNWTGCYIGANVGGGWAYKSFVEGANSIAVGESDGSHTATGWLGGGQVGCDYQVANNWVIGVQGLWDAADLTGSNAGPANLAPFTWETRVSSVATLMAKLGYLFNPVTQLYGKAGVGWVRDRFTCAGVGCSPAYILNDTRSGFDLGIGLAWMFAPNWDVFVEYDHMWLGDKTLTFTSPPGAPFDEAIKQRLDKVLVGVDYRFALGH